MQVQIDAAKKPLAVAHLQYPHGGMPDGDVADGMVRHPEDGARHIENAGQDPVEWKIRADSLRIEVIARTADELCVVLPVPEIECRAGSIQPLPGDELVALAGGFRAGGSDDTIDELGHRLHVTRHA